MKAILILISFLANTLTGLSQFYQGLERMCWKNNDNKIECFDSPRKWYHSNTILIEKDSIFIYKVPVKTEHGKMLFSASDGAFYYDFGIIKQFGRTKKVFLTGYNCDYCGKMIRLDSITGFKYPEPRLDTLDISKIKGGIKIGKTNYKLFYPNRKFYFPSKELFYFDSNSISRINPTKQYQLIAQGIKDFVKTNELKLDKDTLRICTERFSLYEKNSLVELLNPKFLKIEIPNVVLQFFSENELVQKASTENRVIRFVAINNIYDYWKMARIDLTYKILIPKGIHGFSERQYQNSFTYNKYDYKYVLSGDIPKNDWMLVEQK